MIISDLNYVEAVSEQEISVEGGNVAFFGGVIAKDIRATIVQSAVSESKAVGGLTDVAILYSGVGSISAPTNATSSASNSLNINFSA